MNLQDLDDGNFALMNLGHSRGTNINEFEAKAGSQTMMDFTNGNPLANSDIKDMHMKKGASIDFAGASGKQEVNVMNKFEKGSSRRAKDAIKSGNMNAAGTGLDD